MGEDNVDIFRNIIFSLPPLKHQVAAMVLLSPIYSFLCYLAFNAFAPVELHLSTIPLGALAFLLPNLLATELFVKILPDYPRKWSYFLASVNQLIIFLYLIVLSGANNSANAWSVIWLTLITVYLTNILVLVMSVGMKHYKRILGFSLAQPMILLGLFHLLIGRLIEITAASYLSSLVSLFGAAIFLVLILLTVDYLLKSNTKVSAFKLSSGLLQNRRSSLDLGFDSRPEVQTLQIDNGEEMTFVAPWIHPGPIGGFGGGKLSRTLIENLNQRGNGFFLHVPCTHKEDLADPADWKKVRDAVESPDNHSKASRLISRDYGEVSFHGRRFDGKKIVFMDAEDIDDYDIRIFTEGIDPEEVLLVDLHNHDIQDGPEKELQYGTVEAEELKQKFDSFLEELENQELHEYKAGFHVAESGERMALFEETGGQEVLVMGSDTNGLTDDLRQLAEKYREEFDEVLLFSTDTHASVHEMAKMKESNIEEMKDAVEGAVDSLKPASLGLASRKTQSLKLLKYEYSGLIFSINIMIRLVFISLFVFYIFLILWIF